MKNSNKNVMAATLGKVADKMLTVSANSRCVVVFHQPKQPDAIRKFRKF